MLYLVPVLVLRSSAKPDLNCNKVYQSVVKAELSFSFFSRPETCVNLALGRTVWFKTTDVVQVQ